MQKYGITRADHHLIEKTLPSIKALIPIRTIPGVTVRVGDRMIKSNITGTNHEYGSEYELEISKGRFLSQADETDRNNVAVIDASQATRLFENQNPIGRAIQFEREYFTVVGVVQSHAEPAVFIPITTMRSRMGDIAINQRFGSFEMNHYELSELDIVLSKNAEVTHVLPIIHRIFNSHTDQSDFAVEVKQ